MSLVRGVQLAFEVTLALVGDKEGADRAIGVIGAEIAVAEIELCDDPISANRFEDVATLGRIPELLSESQILLRRDVAEFLAVFRVVFLELFLRTEAGATRSQH